VKTNYARSKQEQSLKIFELKDEVLALQQENEQLKGKGKLHGLLKQPNYFMFSIITMVEQTMMTNFLN